MNLDNIKINIRYLLGVISTMDNYNSISKINNDLQDIIAKIYFIDKKLYFKYFEIWENIEIFISYKISEELIYISGEDKKQLLNYLDEMKKI